MSNNGAYENLGIEIDIVAGDSTKALVDIERQLLALIKEANKIAGGFTQANKEAENLQKTIGKTSFDLAIDPSSVAKELKEAKVIVTSGIAALQKVLTDEKLKIKIEVPGIEAKDTSKLKEQLDKVEAEIKAHNTRIRDLNTQREGKISIGNNLGEVGDIDGWEKIGSEVRKLDKDIKNAEASLSKLRKQEHDFKVELDKSSTSGVSKEIDLYTQLGKIKTQISKATNSEEIKDSQQKLITLHEMAKGYEGVSKAIDALVKKEGKLASVDPMVDAKIPNVGTATAIGRFQIADPESIASLKAFVQVIEKDGPAILNGISSITSKIESVAQAKTVDIRRDLSATLDLVNEFLAKVDRSSKALLAMTTPVVGKEVQSAAAKEFVTGNKDKYSEVKDLNARSTALSELLSKLQALEKIDIKLAKKLGIEEAELKYLKDYNAELTKVEKNKVTSLDTSPSNLKKARAEVTATNAAKSMASDLGESLYLLRDRYSDSAVAKVKELTSKLSVAIRDAGKGVTSGPNTDGKTVSSKSSEGAIYFDAATEAATRLKAAFNSLETSKFSTVKTNLTEIKTLVEEITGKFSTAFNLGGTFSSLKEFAAEIKKINAEVSKVDENKQISNRLGIRQTRSEARAVYMSGIEGDATGPVEAYYRRLSELQAKQIKNDEAQAKVRATIQRAQDEADEAAVEKAKKRLQRLQEIEGQRYLKSLPSGLEHQNGYEVPTDKTLRAAYIENTKRAEVKNPFQDMLAGLPVVGTSIDQVKNKLEEMGITQSRVAKMGSAELGQLNNALKPFKLTVDRSTGSLQEMGKYISGLGPVINVMTKRLLEFYSIRTILFSIGTQFRTAAVSMMDLNQGIHDVIAISGGAADSFKELEISAINIAKSTKFSAAEIAEGMKVLAQAGAEAKDLPQMAQVTAILATGSGSTMEQSSKLLTTAMNVWKMDATRGIEVANMFTAALNSSKLEIGELGTAFNYLASQSKLSGRTLTETTAMISVLSNQGQKASTIGTSMSSFLGALLNPNKRVKEYLKEYNLTPADVDPTKKSLAEVVKAFEVAAGKAGISVKDLFYTFDKRVARGAATLFEAGSKELEEMEAKIKNTNAAIVAWAESMKGIKGQFNVLKTEAVDTLSSFINNSGVGVEGAFSWLRNLLAGLRDIQVQTLLTQTAIIGLSTALVALALSNPVTAGLVVAFGALGYAIAEVGKDNKTLAQEFETATASAAKANQEYGVQIDKLMKVASAVKQAKVAKDGSLIVDAKNITLLNELAQKYPAVREALINKKGLHEALTLAINAENTAKEKSLLLDMQLYNAAVDKAEALSGKIRKDYFKETGGKQAPKDLSEIKNEYNIYETLGINLNKKTTEGKRALDSNLAQLKEAQKIMESNGALRGFSQARGYKEVKTKEGFIKYEFDPKFAAEIERLEREKNKTNTEGNLGGDTTSSSTSNKQAFDLAKAKLEAIQAEMEYLKVKAKDLPATVAEVEATATEAFRLLPDMLDKERDKLETEIRSKYPSGKKGVDAEKNEKLMQAELKTVYLKMEVKKIQEEKYWRDLVKSKNDTLAKYSSERIKSETEAETAIQAASQKNYAAIIKSKTTDEKELWGAFLAEKQGIMKEYAAKIKEVNKDFMKAISEISPEMKGEDRDAIMADLRGKRSATIAKLEADRQKAVNEAANQLSSAGGPSISSIEKSADIALRSKQSSLSLQKGQAWSGSEVAALEAEGIQAQVTTQERKNTAYQKFINLQESLHKSKLEEIQADDKNYKTQEAKNVASKAAISQHIADLEDVKTKLREGTDLVAAYKQQWKDVADTSFFGNFTQGVQEAWKKFDDFKASTKELGSSLTNTVTSGLTSSLSNSFTTLFNPDTQKIAELNSQITSLRTQKTTLETEIKTIEANTSKTPEEIKNLNDKKTALDSVNNSLAQQEAAVRKQKDAWATFSEGLKGIMQTILKELQNYIAKMFVVWAVQKLIGIATSVFGGSQSTVGQNLSNGNISGGLYAASGGLITKTGVQHFAGGGLALAGGFIPTNIGVPGKDSVPAMLMPGEVVIKKSSVDYYGADKLLALNEGKISKFADGGFVGSSKPSTSETNGPATAKEWTLQIVNITNGDQVPDPGQQASQIINVINSDIARRGPTFKTIKTAIST